MRVSDDAVAFVRAGFEEFERGDLEAMLGRFAEDLVTHRVPPQPPGTWTGREGFVRALADWTEGFGEWTLALGRVYAPDDTHVLARTDQRAVGAASGVETEAQYWMLFTLGRDVVTRVEFHSTERSALDSIQRGG